MSEIIYLGAYIIGENGEKKFLGGAPAVLKPGEKVKWADMSGKKPGYVFDEIKKRVNP